MYKNILILSSDVTGHGHKSITESLLEILSLDPEIKVRVVDGFSLGGNFGMKIGKMYGSITRTAKEAWKLIYEISEKRPHLMIEMTEAAMQDRFINLLEEMKPDAILTVHANFNTSVTNIMDRLGLNIPLFTIIADPITISPMWCNPRASYTICPTSETRDICLKHDVPSDRVTVIGFPVRKRFYQHLLDESGNILNESSNTKYVPNNPLRFLIMSGGEGSGNMSRLARILLKNFPCTVTLVCGRNKLLKTRLEHTLSEKYAGRVHVLGFTENIQELMLSSDIMFARASPNTMMEAVMCNIPLVITGALPGQEEGNPGYAVQNGLGVVCMEPAGLKDAVASLLANDHYLLRRLKNRQVQYRNPHIARNIVEFIQSH